VPLQLLRTELLGGEPLKLDLVDEQERIILRACGFRDGRAVSDERRMKEIKVASDDELDAAQMRAMQTLIDEAGRMLHAGHDDWNALFLAQHDLAATLVLSGSVGFGQYLGEAAPRFVLGGTSIGKPLLVKAWSCRLRALWRLAGRHPLAADELLYEARLIDDSESAGHLMLLAGLVARVEWDLSAADRYVERASRLAKERGFEGTAATEKWPRNCLAGKLWPSRL
jgi:hypothetical protein